MPNSIFRYTASWVDDRGYYGHTKNYLSAADSNSAFSVESALLTAIQATSNALLNGLGGAPNGIGMPGEYGTNATYAPIESKARLTFVASDGTLHRLEIPSPKLAIFLSDQQTVDRTNALVVAITSIVLNSGSAPDFVSTRGGEGFASFAGGLFVRRKLQRRISIFTLAPGGAEPAE